MEETGESRSEPLPLTFGVELEYMFVIDKRRVQTDLNFHFLRPQHYIRDPQDQVCDEGVFDPTDDDCRTLCQAATVLRSGGVDLAVKLFPKWHDDLFHRWSLTMESAVVHPDSHEEWDALAAELEKNDHAIGNLDDVELKGIELISPILKAPDMDAQRYLSGGSFEVLDRAIATTSQASVPFAFIAGPKTTSVHVHVGVQPDDVWGPEDIPFDVCQHLAWLVVAYEDVITLLHHPERHGYVGTKIYNMGKSTRHSMVRFRGHTCDKAPVFEPWTIFNRIFKSKSHLDLRQLMGNDPSDGDRYTMVNFSHIASTAGYAEPIKTVEFRQHCGTGNAVEIKEWVYFVTSLLRTAERMANATTDKTASEGSSQSIKKQKDQYQNIFSVDKRTVKELFDLMQLPIERRRYWFERAKRFRSDEFASYFTGGTCYEDCTGSMTRDAHGWGAGEVIDQPWSPSSSPTTNASTWSDTSVLT